MSKSTFTKKELIALTVVGAVACGMLTFTCGFYIGTEGKLPELPKHGIARLATTIANDLETKDGDFQDPSLNMPIPKDPDRDFFRMPVLTPEIGDDKSWIVPKDPSGAPGDVVTPTPPKITQR